MTYGFPPIIVPESRILIVGTLPGTRSLNEQQYYAEPRNHFWRIIYDVFGDRLSDGYEERCAFIVKHNLALWDVLYHAQRKGALDSAIQEAVPNDFDEFLYKYPQIHYILFNGCKAEKLFLQHCHSIDKSIKLTQLPSTSPVPGRNVLNYENKLTEWKRVITDCLQQ